MIACRGVDEVNSVNFKPMSSETPPLIRRVKVVAVTRETPSAASFVLEPQGWTSVWRSGQFLTLVFNTRFGEKRRSFSISSSYELGEPLRITVKRLDNGEFSRLLFDQTVAGDELLTIGVGGMFTLPEDPADYRGYCFLAAGSGIAPVFPLIHTLLKKTSQGVTLLYSSRSIRECIFYNELVALAAAEPRFRLRFFLSDQPKIDEGRLGKLLLSRVIDEMFPEAESTAFYLCGPFDYMQTARIVLLMRTRAEHIHAEHFVSWPRLILPEPPDKIPHEVTLRLGGIERTIVVGFPEPVLKAAKKAGLTLPYSCETGRCGSCVASVAGGKFWMAYNEMLTDREVEAGRVLTCQAFPVGGNGILEF
jgi:ring-1,2-phenylacetyl-CoA epoxidase subunit PaaE